ncbi:recombinase RecT [Polynucleobacter sp. UB-Piko-W3]|uniref:recombinase RecT n=1 Tax=Polynucleobacter sp. UB-Piko-W3 TaxID=1819735 RepID=UPI001C0B1FA1|nr:recombinase RecT [Polynucleobacter sp. UB-Piko-W3]MBU3555423.1 recombinase RecT [Polynucleobacter sp. UB-Piko-W3]
MMKRTTGKRTHTLKSILERQQVATAAAKVNSDGCISMADTTTLFDIQEDLIEGAEECLNPISHTKVVSFNTKTSDQVARSSMSKSIELFHDLIDKELIRAAAGLGADEAELQAWVDLQIEVPAKTILTLLRMMQSLHLDPLCEEIGFTQYDDGHWQIFITIEGCSKLLNQHPQFNGLVFNQADTLVEGVPEWVECSIYRRDRIMPITVREYLIEVRSEKEIWQKMPRRMLRHRALQQCVRLAMG